MTTHVRALLWGALAVVVAHPASGQQVLARPPVIDIHVHGAPPRADTFNVRYRLITGSATNLAKRSPDPARFIPAIGFPCDSSGRDVFLGGPCYLTATAFPDTAWLRAEIKAGRIGAL